MGIKGAWGRSSLGLEKEEELEAKRKSMSLDQVHKKIERKLKTIDKLKKEYNKTRERFDKLEKNDNWYRSEAARGQKRRNDSMLASIGNKIFKHEQELEEWDKLREEKVEEEVESEENEEQLEQEEEKMEEAVTPTNYHIPWKEANLKYEHIKTAGWGTKEQRVKRMSVQDVEIKIQGQELEIQSILEQKNRMTKAKNTSNWFQNNKFWSKRWREAVREKAEWEQIKSIKLGAKEDSIEDYDEEEEQQRLNEILGQSYSERWGDRPSDVGDDSVPENMSVINDSEEELEEEMEKEFGGVDPRWVYEDTRQGVKEADKLLHRIQWIDSRLKGLRNLAGKFSEIISDGMDIRWLKKTTRTLEQSVGMLEKKREMKDPDNLYEVKSKLEKIIRKGVKKMEKQRRLIEKKDIYDSWGLLKQYTHYSSVDVSSGYSRSRSSGLQYTIKKFR